MSRLYVYAVVGATARGLGRGLSGRPLRLVRCGGVLAVVSARDAAPAVTPANLRAHDAIVRRLATKVDALLPARFGSLVDDERALHEALAPRAVELGQALALVAGCEQMTLRVYGRAHPSDEAGADAVPAGVGPGARYLGRRLRALRVPEIEPLRRALGGLVRAERAERHGTPPLIASVYHLVPRGRTRAYRAAILEVRARLGDVSVRASGPWAPYAFAPEALG